MSNYKCYACGAEYVSQGDKAPPGIRWSDGHVCTPVLIVGFDEDKVKPKND